MRMRAPVNRRMTRRWPLPARTGRRDRSQAGTARSQTRAVPAGFSDFPALCLANNVSTIVDRIERDQRVHHCAINVQGVVAKVPSGPVTKPTCRGDDAGMRAASGMGLTCADVRAREMCVMFNTNMTPKNYCGCSCPHAKPGAVGSGTTSRKLWPKTTVAAAVVASHVRRRAGLCVAKSLDSGGTLLSYL